MSNQAKLWTKQLSYAPQLCDHMNQEIEISRVKKVYENENFSCEFQHILENYVLRKTVMHVSLKFILFHTVLNGFQQLSSAWYRYDLGIKGKIVSN